LQKQLLTLCKISLGLVDLNRLQDLKIAEKVQELRTVDGDVLTASVGQQQHQNGQAQEVFHVGAVDE
jgi:hypothetical protein